MLLLLLGCDDPPREIDFGTGDSGADSATLPEEIEAHCGVLRSDTTWDGGVHHLTCDVEVEGATLTITGGAEVVAGDGVGLEIGLEGSEAALVVLGSSESPVTLRPAGGDVAGGWDGVRLGEFTTASFAETDLRGASAAAVRSAGRVETNGLRIARVEGAGVQLDGAGVFAGGGTLSVEEAGEWAVVLPAAAVATLPDVTAEASIHVEGGDITGEATWVDHGVPYVAEGDVDVEGTALEPAVLTLGPGVEIRFDSGAGIHLARSGGAAGLRVLGQAGSPVRLTSLAATEPGAWDGIVASEGTLDDELTLSHAEIEWAGGGSQDAALYVESTHVLLDVVSITGCAGTGIRLDGDARFAPGSDTISVEGCDAPMRLPAAAVGDLDGVDLFIGDDLVWVDGGAVSEPATWPALSVWIDGDVVVDGTGEEAAVLTLTAGSTFYMGGDAGFFVGQTGAAGLAARGTAEAPIRFLPGLSETPGDWSGIGLYGAVDDARTVLEHLEVGYGGGSSLKGDIHVSDASPTLSSLYLHHSAEYGLYLDGDAAPTLGQITYADNDLGDTNR